ncbi:MAG: DUF262 domain-containing protein [bacterium]|nr:DUF262 domain-containing protein [bacterium]
MVAQERDIEIIDNLEDGHEEALPFKYSITSYGADYTIDSLVKRLSLGDIYIPSLQRGFVWDLRRASRFVESLLLGLPVPGIFLSREEPSQRLVVVDGQQRLNTLLYFYDGIFANTGKEFALSGLESRFRGKTYKSLTDEGRRRLDDSILHATIIRQDEPSDGDSSIYLIFERLNTGGLALQPQEIRASLYHGEFNDLLKELKNTKNWRAIFGKVNPRMRDQELILRFLGLYFSRDKYEKPMKEFLNTYMGGNKHLAKNNEIEIRNAFETTIEVAYKCLGTTAFKPRRALNAAVYDAVLVGIAHRLANGQIQDCEALKTQYDNLLFEQAFISATETGTSAEDSVSSRISLATEAFEDID